jgi:hypothetical protein
VLLLCGKLAIDQFYDQAECQSIGLDCELSKEIHSLWRDRGCEIFPEDAVLVLPAQIYRVPTSKRTIIAIDFKQYPCTLVAIGVVQLDCCTAEGCKTGLARPLENFTTKPFFFSFEHEFVLVNSQQTVSKILPPTSSMGVRRAIGRFPQ